MAVDSIIARPTNSVRVIVDAASGCCASELSAVETALPSPRAGPRTPKPVVMPAVTIDATAMMVLLSKVPPSVEPVHRSVRRHRATPWLRLAGARCGGNVHRRENAEDVSLYDSGEQTQQRHHDRKDERRDGQQDRDDHRSTHHVAKQTHREGERTRQLADDIEWQHDERRLQVRRQVA